MYIHLDIWARISLFTDVDIIPGNIKAIDGAVINLLHRYLGNIYFIQIICVFFCLISIFASFEVGVTGRPTIVGPDAYSHTA